jgi:hypothetical protein
VTQVKESVECMFFAVHSSPSHLAKAAHFFKTSSRNLLKIHGSSIMWSHNRNPPYACRTTGTIVHLIMWDMKANDTQD